MRSRFMKLVVGPSQIGNIGREVTQKSRRKAEDDEVFGTRTATSLSIFLAPSNEIRNCDLRALWGLCQSSRIYEIERYTLNLFYVRRAPNTESHRSIFTRSASIYILIASLSIHRSLGLFGWAIGLRIGVYFNLPVEMNLWCGGRSLV